MYRLSVHLRPWQCRYQPQGGTFHIQDSPDLRYLGRLKLTGIKAGRPESAYQITQLDEEESTCP